MRIRLLLLFAGLICPLDSFGREMQGRIGLGYNSEFANAYATPSRLPRLSLKYGFNQDLATEVGVRVLLTRAQNCV